MWLHGPARRLKWKKSGFCIFRQHRSRYHAQQLRHLGSRWFSRKKKDSQSNFRFVLEMSKSSTKKRTNFSNFEAVPLSNWRFSWEMYFRHGCWHFISACAGNNPRKQSPNWHAFPSSCGKFPVKTANLFQRTDWSACRKLWKPLILPLRWVHREIRARGFQTAYISDQWPSKNQLPWRFKTLQAAPVP